MKILLDANVIGEIARPDSPYRANLLSRFNNFPNADFFISTRFIRKKGEISWLTHPPRFRSGVNAHVP